VHRLVRRIAVLKPQAARKDPAFLRMIYHLC
jgi:hypothetical protein